MAAHLHDSVLQTLALIQRRADDPGRFQAVDLLQSLEQAFAFVDHAVDHRFGQRDPDHFGRAA